MPRSAVLLAALASLLLSLCFGAATAGATKLPSFEFGEPGTEGGQFDKPRGVAINEEGEGGVPAGTVYVVDFNNNRIQSFAPDDSGTPADPSDDSVDFLRAWGWDVVEGGGAGFEICEVAAECKAGSSGGGAGQFDTVAGGIAVNQSTGDVYVNDRANSRVQRFTATGGFISAWGKDVDGGDPGEGFEICTEAPECQAGEDGTGAGELGFAGTAAIVGIGTDEAGNVYLADSGNHRIQKFDSEGNFVAMGGWDVVAGNVSVEYEVCAAAEAADCQAGVAGTDPECQFSSNNGAPNFLANAPSGDVYVVDRGVDRLYHLTPALACVEASPVPPVVTEGSDMRAIAVNAADGHLFVAKQTDTPEIYEIDTTVPEIVDEHPAVIPNWVGLAVDSLTGRMYAAQNTGDFVRAFDDAAGELPEVEPLPPAANSGTRATLAGTVDPNEVALEECKFEWADQAEFEEGEYGNIEPCVPGPAGIGEGDDPVEVQAEIAGLTPHGATYHYRLFAKNENGGDSAEESFETPDTVFTEAASEVAPTTATLNGSVNPDSEEIAGCRFEWGTTTSYGESAPCVPGPAGIGSGESPVPVSAELEGLAPGSAYHFRLETEYAGGAVVRGADQGFQTPGPGIAQTWSVDVTSAEAVLKAEINPEGKATTYRFQYGTSPAYGEQTPELDVGSDEALHEVSALLEGLQAGTTYHYRVVATNPDAINMGPDRSFATYALPGADGDCANRAFRAGPAAALPDCRAYEMVSPADKNGGDIVAIGGIDNGKQAAHRQSSPEGNRITYTSKTAFGDAQRGALANQYLSSRDAVEGWSTDGLNPPQGTTVFDPDANASYDRYINFLAFSEDLCSALVRDHNLTPLSGSALAGHTNLYRRDNCGEGAGGYHALSRALAFPANVNLATNYGSISRNGAHVVFGAGAALESTPLAASNANSSQQIYERSGGELRLVSVLPGGDEASEQASAVGHSYLNISHGRDAPLKRAVSADGSRIFWTSGGAIYVRVDGEATVPIAGGGEFLTASADGSKAVFATGDLGSAEGELFEFDVDKALAGEAATATTPIAGEAGGVVGAGEDLSHLYFTSREELAPGASGGEDNVYLRRAGEPGPRFVATVSAKDRGVGVEAPPSVGPSIDSRSPFRHSSRVTPDGRHLAFMSNRSLTGYDNADAISGEATSEVFIYDAGAGRLSCASCKPSGARPLGRALGGAYRNRGTVNLHVAAWLPTWEWSNHGKRSLSDDGERLFFNSYDALALRDTNGAQDVYQWEAPGSGSCDVGDASYSEQNGGCVSLISTGQVPSDSELLDASADGRDVFFTTSQRLDGRDRDGSVDLYDARVGGGFPPPPPEPPACVGDACQDVPAPPGAQTPASAIFAGPGNPAPARNCGAIARRAAKNSRRAKRLRRVARRSAAQRRSRQLRRRSARHARNAKRLSNKAKRCRGANRRAGR